MTQSNANGIWQQPPAAQPASEYAAPAYTAQGGYYQQPAPDGYAQLVPPAYQEPAAAPTYASAAPDAAYQQPYAPAGYPQPAGYQQAPPAQPPYGGYQTPGYYGPAGSVPLGAPAGEAPGIGMVIVITALFGLFGLIPTTGRAKKAKALGLGGGKYWAAFGITLVASSIAGIIMLAVMLAGASAAVTAAAADATVESSATAAPAQPAGAKPATGGTYTTLTDRSWLQIVKSPEGHKGEKVVIYGRINQFDSATGTEMFIANAGPTQYESESDTNTTFSGNSSTLADFVEGDPFRAKAIVVGSFDYDTQGGGHTVTPQLQIVSIEKVK